MGSKINVKFVAILSAVLVGVVGLLAVPAYMVLTKSAEDHMRAGDKSMQEGEIKKAINEYGKAVNEERSNVAYVKKWREAIESYTPEDQTEYRSMFNLLFGSVYEIAFASKTDLAAWEEYFACARIASNATRTQEHARLASGLMKSSNPQGSAIVRRYMALPVLAELLTGARQVESDELEILEANLRAALEARTDDHEVVRGIVSLHRFLARKALADLDEPKAREHARAAAEVVDAALASHPDHPIFRLTRLEVFGSVAMRQLLDEPLVEGEPLIDKAELDQAALLLSQWPTDKISLDEISLLQFLEMSTGSGMTTHTLALTERLAREAPDDMMMRWGRAFALRTSNKLEEAYQELQFILDRPMQKVSIVGIRQFPLETRSLSTQSYVAFKQWERAGTDEQLKQLAKDRMRSRNEEMTRRLPADSPLLLIARGRIAYADSDLAEASRLIREYEQRVGADDADANWMLANLAMSASNLTEAGRRLDVFLEQNSNDGLALSMRANVHKLLREYDEALELYLRLQRGLPDNEAIDKEIESIRIAMGEITSSDPVLAAINESIEVARGTADEPGDFEGAASVLERAIEAGLDAPEIFRQLAQYRLNQDDISGARIAIARGTEANPADTELARFAGILNSGETMPSIIDMFIDAGEGTPIEKLTRKASSRWQIQDIEKTREYIQQAQAIEPENPVVVELGFRLALMDNDLDRATALAEIGQRIDLDSVGGRTMLADIRQLEDDLDGALALLEEAADLRPDRIDLLRRLGRMQFRIGQTNEGLATYANAMSLRGNDQSLIQDYANQLRAVGRSDEALRMLLTKQALTRGNSAIFDLRIDLEAEVGDRQWALNTRRTLAQRDPTDRSNRIKLTKLHMDLAQWAEAKTLIDSMRAEGDSLELATLAAIWHGDQGDIESARADFSNYIGALFETKGDLDSPTPYLQLGQLLIRYGDIDGGLNAIRQARRWENPQTLRVEKFLADQLGGLARWPEAIESYRIIVDAGKDTRTFDYALRLAQALGRIGEFEEAEQILASLADEASKNESVLLLRSENAAQMEEMERARELVQSAIELFPESSRAYVQRARLTLRLAQVNGSERLLLDAREDLTIALTRNPAHVDAYLIRSQVNSYLGNRNGMLGDLRSAVFARPPTNSIVTSAVRAFSRAGQAGGAVEIADHAITTRPNDPSLLREIGNAFAVTGDFGRASIYFAQAWERSKDAATTQRYVQSLLLEDPPRYRVVMEVLGPLEAILRDSPGLLLGRCEALFLASQKDFAIEDARRAFALLVENQAGMARWFGEVNRIFEDRGDFLAVIEAAKRGGQHRRQLDLFAARGLSSVEDTESQAHQIYDALIAQNAEPHLQRSAYVFKGAAFMELERFEEAVSVWQEGLTLHPNEWQFHNNIAYVLAERLGRPQEALPYAQEAFNRMPRVAAIVDTLGWVQHLVGDDAAAEITLEEALRLIGAPENDATITLHLAIVLTEMGKKELALNLVRTIRVLSQNGANLDETDGELLSEATERINALP